MDAKQLRACITRLVEEITELRTRTEKLATALREIERARRLPDNLGDDQ
jgi:hypothetical protein